MALLERPKKQIAKPKKEKRVLEETFRDLEKLKSKKVKVEKSVPPTTKLKNLLEGFEDIKMQEVVEQEKIENPIGEKKIDEPTAEKRMRG